MPDLSYHSYTDLYYVDRWWTPEVFGEVRKFNVERRDVSYRFRSHFHPFVTDVLTGPGENQEHLAGLASRLVKAGVRGLEEADTLRSDGIGDLLVGQEDAQLWDDTFFDRYLPKHDVFVDNDPGTTVLEGRPIKDLDFSSGGSYAVYNWELFFHVPMAIAMHLSRNGRFMEAQRWLHLLFDPTDDGNDPSPRRFWKVKPFQLIETRRIEQVLLNLATKADAALFAETSNAIAEWADNPFRPFVIARKRQWSFMYKTVMAYLDNLIAWGDHLFRQDTRESINEATQLYVLAANLLGRRPQEVPARGQIRTRSYAELRDRLGPFGSVLEAIETTLPFDTYPLPSTGPDDDELGAAMTTGSLYFCVPRNENLLGYWDTVADRLFKIRNSLNIRGIFRQLPLFQPPIDPALLARGAAAGLDVSAVIAGLNQPLPLVRFRFLINRATELASEVRRLGASLLSAIEKEDAEELGILRSTHERAILELTESVRYAQWQDSLKGREGIERTLNLAVARLVYYERLLGMDPNDIELPEMEDLDVQQLLDGRLRSTEPEITPREIEVDISSGPLSDVSDLLGFAGDLHLNSGEAWGLNTRTVAEIPIVAANVLELLAGGTALFPDVTIAGHPMGVGVDSHAIGGEKASGSMGWVASATRAAGEFLARLGGRMETAGSYARREQEWSFQSSLAAGEIGQINKQLRAAQIREFIARREYETHQKQMVHAEEIETFLSDERKGKTTNKNLYSWLRREVQALHNQGFQLAFDVAKKAERALQHEFGDTDLTYLRYNYQAGKEGLLAGERLHLAVKQMEVDYHDRNRREYELVKNVSLLQINPLALLQLRATGRCTFALTEELFDFDGPHYFRRIKSVDVTFPAVVGRFASINCNLRLVNSSIRTTPGLENGYARVDAEDPRFNDHHGTLEAIVTSTGQNDSGMFQHDLNDERYLPFEGSGVISEWQLELPADPSEGDPAQFDYQTISDVILQFRYTARDGGDLFRTEAMENLKDKIAAAEAAGSTRMFSIRHEFPTEWARFKSSTIDAATPSAPLTVPLRPQHYPFWSQDQLSEFTRFQIVLRTSDPSILAGTSSAFEIDLSTTDDLGPLLRGELTTGPLPSATGPVDLHFSATDDVDDIWLLVTWGGG